MGRAPRWRRASEHAIAEAPVDLTIAKLCVYNGDGDATAPRERIDRMHPCACEHRIRELEGELARIRQELAETIAERAKDRAHQRQLAAVVEASRDAIWSWTPDGIINSWNGEAERLLQYKAEEIIGQSLLVLVAPDRVARAREVIGKLRQGGWYEQYDTVRVRKDGVRVAVELTVSPIRNAAGDVVGAATVCRDITLRKQQERALRQSEERFAKLFDLAPIAMSVSTLDEGRYLAVNNVLLATTGYTREEVMGRTARELRVYTNPADFQRIRELLATGQSLRELEVELRGKRGDARTTLLSAEVIALNGRQCLLSVVVDISERKKAQETLAASEARLRAVLESLYDGVAAVDAAGKLVFINDAMARLLGFSRVAALPVVDLGDALAHIQAYGEDGRALAYAQRPLIRALSGETVIDLPLRMRQPAQEREYDVFNSAIPVRDSMGNVTMAVIRMRDVTEQKNTLRALQLSQDRYAMAMRAVDAMVYDWDITSGRVERSDGLERILGIGAREAEPTVDWWRARIHPDDRSPWGPQVEAELAGRERHVAEYRIRHGDGRWIDVADRGIAVYDRSGRPIRVVGSTVDVSHSKRAQQALRESEERYRSLVENANDIVATLDLDFRITSVNPAVTRILGYSPEELIGRPLSHYAPEDQLAMQSNMLAQMVGASAATRYEMQLFGKDRRRRYTLEVNSKVLVDASNQPVAIHAIARDITERKEAEARQSVLVRELQHRTKNMLAVIQAIVSQTLARSPDLASAQEALVGRLHALAHAQEFVAAGAGGGVPLRELVQAELALFGARAAIDGEPLVIGGAFAQTLALVVHELATNAIKHGALAARGGHVAISWTIGLAADPASLIFLWQERGGPPAHAPGQPGFGTRVLQMAGAAQLTFAMAGFEYRLAVPLAEAVKGQA
jgi:PAS domain S-box-containing protein